MNVPFLLDKEIRELKKKADGGDVDAQFQLGCKYRDGSEKLKKDYVKAFQYFEKAANQGDLYAMGELAICYKTGLGGHRNQNLAFQYCEKATKSGDPVHLYNMGYFYEVGCGTECDRYSAFKWYLQAAEKGYVDAQYKVAKGYSYGEGTSSNLIKALYWFRKIEVQGFQIPNNELNRCKEKLRKEFEKECPNRDFDHFYNAVFINNDADAQYEMAKHFSTIKNDKVDMDEAFKWAELSAAQGCVNGIALLGSLWDQGSPKRKRDYVLAAEYYERAGNLGNGFACYELSQLYLLGYGVNKDLIQRANWLKKAGEFAYEESYLQLAYAYLNEDPGFGEEDYEKALYWFEKATNNSHLDAVELCKEKIQKRNPNYSKAKASYEQGMELLPSDQVTAKSCLEMASQLGHDEAAYELGILALQQNKKQEALSYFEMASKRHNGKALLKLSEFALREEIPVRAYFLEGAAYTYSVGDYYHYKELYKDVFMTRIEEAIQAYKNGIAEKIRGNLEVAIANFSCALAAGYEDARDQLDVLDPSKKYLDKVYENVKRYTGLSSDEQLKLGIFYYGRGNREEAKDWLLKSYKQDPNEYNVCYLGRIALDENNLEDALRYFEFSAKKGNVDAQYWLGYAKILEAKYIPDEKIAYETFMSAYKWITAAAIQDQKDAIALHQYLEKEVLHIRPNSQ